MHTEPQLKWSAHLPGTTECYPLGNTNRLRVSQVNRWEILGNRRKARKVRIKRLRPIGCWWHSRWLQSHSLARTSVRHGYISEPSPAFPCSNTPKGQLDLV